MKTFKNLLLLSAITVGIIAFQSCNKSETNVVDEKSKTETINEDFAQTTFDEIQDIADQAFNRVIGFKSVNGDGSKLGSCATITHDTISVPRVITIDFGTVNCLCPDGKYRRGQIIITYTGRFRRISGVVTHTFNNFYVNDNHVQGTKVMTNLGPNSSGFPQFRKVVNGSITMINDGTVISWNSTHTRTFIAGFNTAMWTDDVFLIEGNSTVSNSNGGGIARLITVPLRKEATCHHFVSGTVKITPINKPERILDYGDGTCDNIATLTIGDRTITIKLRR